MSQRYFVSDGIFFCECGADIVILNLETGRYQAVTDVNRYRLAPHIFGWVDCNPRDDFGASRTPQDPSELLRNMEKGGVLTKDATKGREFVPITTDRPRVALVEAEHDKSVRVTMLDLFNFSVATLSAHYLLRDCAIKDIVEKVNSLRRNADYRSEKFDHALGIKLTTKFHRLRPWFPRDYLCIFDALALVLFLSRYGVFPHWVFGVKSDPIYAHCWVQQDDVAYDDYTESINAMTPIMVV